MKITKIICDKCKKEFSKEEIVFSTSGISKYKMDRENTKTTILKKGEYCINCLIDSLTEKKEIESNILSENISENIEEYSLHQVSKILKVPYTKIYKYKDKLIKNKVAYYKYYPRKLMVTTKGIELLKQLINDDNKK